MRSGIQKSKIISLCAILAVLSFQTAVVAKKKPKRRSARAKAAKRVIPALPAFFVRNVQTISTTAPDPAANTPRMTAANAPGTTATITGAPTLSIPQAAAPGQLLISEFRVRGPNGSHDEFIEIYNSSGADHTVAAAFNDGSQDGYGIAASDGVTRCYIPNGTVIPNRGHYLCVNSVGYSLAAHPAGNGTTATGDATYTLDIPDNDGVAIFNNTIAGGYAAATRIDAVGSTSAPALYREGPGLMPLAVFAVDSAWVRDTCGKDGSLNTFGPCPTSFPTDSENNAADFFLVDPNGNCLADPPGPDTCNDLPANHPAKARLGAPGPENLSSPIQRNASFAADLFDPCVADTSVPNRERNTTAVPQGAFGTLEIRRTFTNNTGGNVTRLRFRVIDITTFPAGTGIADLRPVTSGAIVVPVDRAPCGFGTSNITVQGTTLEQPPTQTIGGGFNSTLSAGTITLATPLPPVDNPGTPGVIENQINLRFVLGVQQTGLFKIYMNIEALP